MSNKSGDPSQLIALPKGGGALNGIGEKFSPDLQTGTGNFTVPIGLPLGRNGFQPELSLVYSTGNGNSQFGLGWNLTIPGISRKTAKGIPVYDDARDIFILSGAEDLVPVPGGSSGFTRYRPRTEGLFARIEHHHGQDNEYWEVRSKNGLVSFYGTPGAATDAEPDPATIADPDNPKHIFTWKLTRTVDTFGNRIDYLYERDSEQIEGAHHWDQLYLSSIRYVDYGDPSHPEFLVTVKFTYEDRSDRFSDYRAGFEIRTVRRCTRVDISTHKNVEIPVRTYRLVYLDQRGLPKKQLPHNGSSMLSQVEVIGYDDDGKAAGELAPLEFGYSRFDPDKRDFFPLSGRDIPPGSLSQPDYALVDLFGNGLPDVLHMNGTVRYWRNLGAGRFDLAREMQTAPAGLGLADRGVQLIDANGDGRIDLLVSTERLTGYYPLTFHGLWDRRSFQRHRAAPSFDLKDPEVQLIDLNGDGVTDAIRSGSRLECFFNDPHEGWNETRCVERRALEVFPNVNFSDPRVKCADMSGDGLQDIVLVMDGSVEYWPNLGYGEWGRRVRMKNSPRFPYGYDPKRILTGDVDGDGLADLVYVDDSEVTLWINQSGNEWSDPILISGTPPLSNTDAVRLSDMLGSGISGVVWSGDAKVLSRESFFFLDFTGGIKPYLLNEMDNHIGAVTRVGYLPSTHFYLEDQKRPEARWKTPLPFPVQVVARVEVVDKISRGKLTVEYSYHHGYWDGVEREFRGFGRTDHRDTEVFEDFHSAGLHPLEQIEIGTFSPPLETRTWFHQGPVVGESGDWEQTNFSKEFWSGDPQVFAAPPSLNLLLKGLPRNDKHDALRALRGRILRTEMYALDDAARQDRPYSVTEYLYDLREEAAPEQGEGDRMRIFFPQSVARRTTQWERGDDPLHKFSFSGEYDLYGQPRSLINIAVPRNRKYQEEVPPGAPSPQPYLVTHKLIEFAQRDDAERYIVDRVARTTAYESKNDGRDALWHLKSKIENKELDLLSSIIGQTMSYYDRDDSQPDGGAFVGLPLGSIGDYGALVRTESLILTEETLRDAYKSAGAIQTPPEEPPYFSRDGTPEWTTEYPLEFRSLLASMAGYNFHSDASEAKAATGFFVTAERCRYDFHLNPTGEGRGLILTRRDPLGRDYHADFDDFDLYPVEVTDPVGLKTSAVYNYRVFQPAEVRDTNGNQTLFTFAPSGLVSTTSVRGKAGEGDQQAASVQFSYDFLSFMKQGSPISVRTIRRIHHDTESDVPQAERDETIEGIQYSDGFGRIIQTRAQAEGVVFGDPIFGGAVLPVDNDTGDVTGEAIPPDATPSVVISGWQVYDNKGRVVETYEPSFSTGWSYASPGAEQRGQRVTMFYDPRGQAIRTLNPDGSEQRVVYGVPGTIASPNLEDPDEFEPTPWEAYTYDANDNAGRTHASDKSANQYNHHWDTPSSVLLDALGRTVETVARNRVKSPDGSLSTVEEFRTKSTYDIRGNVLDVTDALGRIAFRYVYDLMNHPLRIESIDAGLRRIILSVVGNVLEYRDSKGALVLHAYDLLSRPVRLWARDDSISPVILRGRTEYGDGGDPDQPKAVREANRLVNLLGKLHRNYDEAGLLVAESYDFKGNLLEKVRQVIADNQLLSIFDPGDDDQKNVEAFRVNWQPPVGATLEIHAAALLDATQYRTSLAYDALSRVKVMLYPQDAEQKRRQLRLRYNRAGALERVELDGATFVEHIAYNARGQRSFIAYGNGLMTRHAYDARTFRLARLRTERYEKSSGADFTYHPTAPKQPLQDFAYQYDLSGNITIVGDRTPQSGIANSLTGANALDRVFTYDPLYRLLSATGREHAIDPPDPPWLDMVKTQDVNKVRSYREDYEYDAVGNIGQVRHQAGSGGSFTRKFTLAPDANRLAMVTIGQKNFNYLYDDDGNLIQATTSRHYEWDYGDRMRVYRTQPAGAEPSLHAQYLYDSTGSRVKKLVRKQNGRVEVTVYIDSVFEHHRTIKSGVNQENNTLHVMSDQNRIALVRVGQAFSDDATPSVKFYLGDHLGSSNVVVDKNGAVINRQEYTPYGETSFGSFTRDRYRFTGKERDEESSLYYHGARYYAPWLGRWTSCDPVGLAEGVNLFRYTRNNPINFTDPEGTQAKDPPAQNAQPSDTNVGNILIEAAPEEFGPPSPPKETKRELPDLPVIDSTKGQAIGPDMNYLREQKKEQRRADLVALSFSPLSTLALIISSMITDDPNKKSAAIQAGAAAWGVAGTMAAAGQARNNLPQVAPQKATSEVPFTPIPSGNRAREITGRLIKLEGGLTNTMKRAAIGVATRKWVSVIGTNNEKIYQALLTHIRSGAILLRPGEYLGKPPIRSGEIPHPDWSGKFVHAEAWAEYQLEHDFGLKGPGFASSVPDGCGFCVPHLYHKGIIHTNPSPSAPTQ
ncbi:MAG: SpvB/TcaC N-terminal domain-containing protein [Blastocatellia bacterium]